MPAPGVPGAGSTYPASERLQPMEFLIGGNDARTRPDTAAVLPVMSRPSSGNPAQLGLSKLQ